jgi:hypothetical protein
MDMEADSSSSATEAGKPFDKEHVWSGRHPDAADMESDSDSYNDKSDILGLFTECDLCEANA